MRRPDSVRHRHCHPYVGHAIRSELRLPLWGLHRRVGNFHLLYQAVYRVRRGNLVGMVERLRSQLRKLPATVVFHHPAHFVPVESRELRADHLDQCHRTRCIVLRVWLFVFSIDRSTGSTPSHHNLWQLYLSYLQPAACAATPATPHPAPAASARAARAATPRVVDVRHFSRLRLGGQPLGEPGRHVSAVG